jgi:MFS transporter, DHA1 family, inner membrane transport protein
MLRVTRGGASNPSVLASVVLALALTGDALLYAILPLEAAAFGITLAGAGVLLSVNRVVRLALFGWFADAARRWGLRRMTVAAAVLGALSTIAVAFSSGMLLLSGARIAWGIAFGILALTTLGYATSSLEGAGARIGLSLSIRETGPLVAYTAGLALAASFGARAALLALGAASLSAVPLALRLPDSGTQEPATVIRPRMRGAVVLRVTRGETIACVLGLVADGFFVTTIGLQFAARSGAAGAAGAAGFAAAALAGKRLAVFALAPLAGRIGDRLGATRAIAVSLSVAAIAFVVLGFGAMTGGVALLVTAVAFAGTLIPLIDPRAEPREHLHHLARLNAARDLGAALGPMAGVALFTFLGSPRFCAISGALLAAAALLARAGHTPPRPARFPIMTPDRPR